MASLDRIFGILAKERRRYALYYLTQQDGPVSVDEVAEQIAEWESNPGTASIPEETFDQIEVELLHVDLPKASKAAYIQFDQEEMMVDLTGPPPEFNAIISIAEVLERPDRHP